MRNVKQSIGKRALSLFLALAIVVPSVLGNIHTVMATEDMAPQTQQEQQVRTEPLDWTNAPEELQVKLTHQAQTEASPAIAQVEFMGVKKMEERQIIKNDTFTVNVPTETIQLTNQANSAVIKNEQGISVASC